MASEGGTFLKVGDKDAGADLSASQYFAVQINSTGKIVLADATVRPLGILQNKPISGRAASVAVVGVCKAIATGTIAIRDALAPDASGRLVTTTTDNDEFCGYALEAHSGNASVIQVLLLGGQRY